MAERWRSYFPALLVALACSSTETPAREPKAAAPVSLACKVDHVREFYCEGLLPMTTALGAPEPYSTCPAGIETPPGVVHPRGDPVARFDAPRTEWARSRAKPGHACCYSWCAPVQITDPGEVLPSAGCDEAGAFRESYCMPELESGTSSPAPAPLDRCPISIRPPEVVHFSVPKSAPLDLATTQQRRGEGQPECCYGWCSRMPASAR